MTISHLTPAVSLAELPTGCPAQVVDIGERWAPRLAAQGIHVGVAVVVESDAPFRGPRVIRLGPTRIAVDRLVARTIAVRPGI